MGKLVGILHNIIKNPATIRVYLKDLTYYVIAESSDLIADKRRRGNYERIYHYHIRKTGGTSLNFLFLSLFSNKPGKSYKKMFESHDKRIMLKRNVFVGWNPYYIERGKYFYAFSHTPSHKLSLPKSTFTITIIRNPIDRVVSHFNMLKEYGIEGNKRLDIEDEINWAKGSFTEFLENIPKEHLLRQLYMFSESCNVDEAFENITQCSHFFFTDDFQKGISELSDELKINLTPMHVRKSVKSKRKLSRKEMKKLKVILEPEIKLYKKLKEYKSK